MDEVRSLSQSIHSHKVLSAEWKEQCRALRRLAEIAMSDSVRSQGDGSESGTLWDGVSGRGGNGQSASQSVSQSVVRLLLESGKLNLVLRLLTNFKALGRSESFGVSLEIECNRKKTRMPTLIQLCSVYEQSLGILLFCCIRRVESLQILDAEHLVQWIGSMLSRNSKQRVRFKLQSERMDSFCTHSFGEDKRAEVMVLHFLFILSSHFAESQLEERLMGHIERYHVIPHSIAFVMDHHHVLALDLLQKYSLFLSHCFAAESFSAEPDLFIAVLDDDDDGNVDTDDDGQKRESQRRETAALLSAFYTKYAVPFLAQKALRTKQLRAYSKQFLRWKKMLK